VSPGKGGKTPWEPLVYSNESSGKLCLPSSYSLRCIST
jgi:hypothetical protein